MTENKLHNNHILVLGAVTVATPFLVTSGYWDIFDFLISTVLLVMVVFYAAQSQDIITGSGLPIVGLCLSIISTSWLISLVAVIAVLFGSTDLAGVDYENAKLLNAFGDDLKIRKAFQTQYFWQCGLFLFSVVFWAISLTIWRNNLPLISVATASVDEHTVSTET